MVVVDAEGRIVLANQQVEVLFGRPIEGLIGEPVEVLVPERFRGMHRRHIGGFFAQPLVRPMGAGRELPGARADGTEVPVEISLSPLAGSEGNLVVAAIRDVSERRHVAQELQRALDREREVADRLRELDRLKDDFLSTVSHELRTPLTAIGGFSEVLLDPSIELPEERRAQLLERVRDNAVHMGGMIEQLLDDSRLQAGKVRLLPVDCDLGELIHDAMRPLETALREHVVVVEVDPDVHVVVDPSGFGRVLGNLLTNAAKFSGPGTTITIGGAWSGADVTVSVTDEGVGLSPEDQEHIFDRFFQADTGDGARRGSGIGLSIARRYAELHGGRLHVRSAPGEGSTFVLTLPSSGR